MVRVSSSSRPVPAPDFWLLDLATKTTRQLTHLSDRGRIQTFDIVPDGKAIVFDRIRAEFGHRPDRSAEVRHASAPPVTTEGC